MSRLNYEKRKVMIAHGPCGPLGLELQRLRALEVRESQGVWGEEAGMDKYKSVFDIIGPIMIGPSSSHTAGAVAIGRVGHILAGGVPSRADIHYYDSFARTHSGHGTDYAIISGLLGFAPDDPRVPDAIGIARRQGMDMTFHEEDEHSPIDHPNTAVLDLRGPAGRIIYSACSIGGGTIEVQRINLDGCLITTPGLLPILLVELDESEKGAGRRLERIRDLLREEGVTKQTRYEPEGPAGMAVYEFDLDNPLSAQQQKQIAGHSSRMIYID